MTLTAAQPTIFDDDPVRMQGMYQEYQYMYGAALAECHQLTSLKGGDFDHAKPCASARQACIGRGKYGAEP